MTGRERADRPRVLERERHEGHEKDSRNGTDRSASRPTVLFRVFRVFRVQEPVRPNRFLDLSTFPLWFTHACGVNRMISTRREGWSAGAGVEGPGGVGAEADRGDLATLEPAGRLDRVLLDQVLAHGVGLLLGEDLGEVLVAVVVGERGDHDLRAGPAGLLAPSGDLVEPGPADGRRAPSGRARTARRRGRRGCSAASRAGRARARGRDRPGGRSTATTARSA